MASDAKRAGSRWACAELEAANALVLRLTKLGAILDADGNKIRIANANDFARLVGAIQCKLLAADTAYGERQPKGGG